MNKTSKKQVRYDQEALLILYKRYGVTKRYIRMSIAGDREGIIPLRIKDEYEKLVKASKKAQQESLKELDASL